MKTTVTTRDRDPLLLARTGFWRGQAFGSARLPRPVRELLPWRRASCIFPPACTGLEKRLW